MTLDARWLRHAVWWLIPAVLSVLLLGACTVPEHMQVRAGIDPRNQDDQVRFRTTYYFRVFDVCHNKHNGKMHGMPQLDSLYRFRMTGKAHPFSNQVHFESGTLHKNEIDPFGSNVVFDENLRRYRFVSREETDITAQRNDRYDEIERRLKLLEKIIDKHDGFQTPEKAVKQIMAELVNSDQISEEKKQQLLDQLTGIVEESRAQAGDHHHDTFSPIMEALINSIRKQIVNLDPLAVDSSANDEVKGHVNSSISKNIGSCPDGTELERGFQILGPEGVSTFKQDQRLVMAMTSRGKPLISTLKELSGRMLKAYGPASEIQLSLAQENIAILRAKRVVDKFEDDQSMTSEQLIEQVIDAFNQNVPQKAHQ